MDDIYHNDAVNHTMEDNTENTAENGYQQPCQDSYQRPVEEQLRYQYQEPESDLEEPVSVGEWLGQHAADADPLCEYCADVCVGLQQQREEEQVQLF